MTGWNEVIVRAMTGHRTIVLRVLMLWFLLAFSSGLPTSLGATSPRLEYESSWIGNSYPGAQRWVPQDIEHIVVTADGTVYSNVHWEEGGGNVTAFKDGAVLGPARRTHGWGNQGGYAVAANDNYLYIAGRMNNEGNVYAFARVGDRPYKVERRHSCRFWPIITTSQGSAQPCPCGGASAAIARANSGGSLWPAWSERETTS